MIGVIVSCGSLVVGCGVHGSGHLALLLGPRHSRRGVERHELRVLPVASLAANGDHFLTLVLLHLDLILHLGVHFVLFTLFDQIDLLLDLNLRGLLDSLEYLGGSRDLEVWLRFLTQALDGLSDDVVLALLLGPCFSLVRAWDLEDGGWSEIWLRLRDFLRMKLLGRRSAASSPGFLGRPALVHHEPFPVAAFLLFAYLLEINFLLDDIRHRLDLSKI